MNKRSSEPLVTFIVLGWNNKALLQECFDSIFAQSYGNFNVVYVDNGSADKSLEYVKREYPQVIRVDAKTNQGFAIGNNIGMEKALENKDCAYVALVNTDATLDKDWLKTLVAFALGHPHSASFQTPTYDYFNHKILDSRGITIDRFGRAIQLGHREENPKLSTRKVFGTNAAANLISREFLDAQPFGTDYLDSDLWMYLEDVDLAARATITGWPNWFVANSKAFHMGSASSSKNPGFSVYHIYRNNVPMMIKNLPFQFLVIALFGAFVTDLKTLAHLLRYRNFIAFKAIVRGRYHGIGMIPLFLSKRRTLKKNRSISSQALKALMDAK